MNIKQTSIRCSPSEKLKIDKESRNRGYKTINFINHCIDKNIPMNKMDFVFYSNEIDKKTTSNNCKRIGAKIPLDLFDKINENAEILSTRFKKVHIFEIILVALFMEMK